MGTRAKVKEERSRPQVISALTDDLWNALIQRQTIMKKIRSTVAGFGDS